MFDLNKKIKLRWIYFASILIKKIKKLNLIVKLFIDYLDETIVKVYDIESSKI